MDQKTKTLAKVGYAAKGIVYIITGGLAVMAAFGTGGQKAGKLQVLDFLEKQAFGKVILGLLGLGLICYALWRFIQSIKDPEDIGDDAKGIVKRISFFISGMIYLAFGSYAIIEIFNQNSSTNNGSFLSGDIKKYTFLIIGIALGIKGIYQFIKAIRGKFLQKFNIKSMTSKTRRKIIKIFAYSGLIARGIVVSIISYFFIKSAIQTTNANAKGTSEALSFIQYNTPYWVFGLIAAGLTAYGLYMFTLAAYRSFED